MCHIHAIELLPPATPRPIEDDEQAYRDATCALRSPSCPRSCTAALSFGGTTSPRRILFRGTRLPHHSDAEPRKRQDVTLSPQRHGFVAAVNTCADNPHPISRGAIGSTPFNNTFGVFAISPSPPPENIVALAASLSISG